MNDKIKVIREALEFIEEITNALGKYTDLNGHRIVADAYPIATKLEKALAELKQSPYKDYTWEDIAMLAQENKVLKEQPTEVSELQGEIDRLRKILDDINDKAAISYYANEAIKASNEVLRRCNFIDNLVKQALTTKE